MGKGALYAGVGIAALGGGLGLAYIIDKYLGGGGGGGPPPTCDQGYFPCSSGVCCPNADSCADSNGGCPSGSTADPDNPGCCINACPPSCTGDSDCAACGDGFVCENGQCTKQQPAVLNASTLTLSLNDSFTYTTTCCIQFLSTSCVSCTGTWTNGNDSCWLGVYDASGRGVPGVDLDISTPSGTSWEAVSDGTVYTSNPVPTGSGGTIYLTVYSDTPPAGYDQTSNYPCGACGSGNASGTDTVNRGTAQITAPAFPGLGTLDIDILDSIYWAETTYSEFTSGACNCGG